MLLAAILRKAKGKVGWVVRHGLARALLEAKSRQGEALAATPTLIALEQGSPLRLRRCGIQHLPKAKVILTRSIFGASLLAIERIVDGGTELHPLRQELP